MNVRIFNLALSLLLVPTLALSSARVPASHGLPPTDAAPGDASVASCKLAREEARLLALLTEHPGQRRATLRCNPKLHEFARGRAAHMAAQGYFSHVTPDRVGPNEMLKSFGYPLPGLYSGHLANNVEAIAAGLETAEIVFRELLASRSHREHLLAEHPFYQEQDEIGIAHVSDPDSEYGDYWVIVIARRKHPDEPRYLCTPEPSICMALSPQ